MGEIMTGLFAQAGIAPWVLVRVIRRWPDFILYLRDELRGKGVAAWLLTQNPKDLEQQHYNYSTEVNFHLCLKVLNAHPQTLAPGHLLPG